MSSSDPNSSRNDDFQLPMIPSDDWEMNVFLKELADGLTDEDLKTMKHFVSGFHGTRKGVLESIKDPLDFFQHLRHRLILTRDNIVVLQSMLWHLGRKDLHNKFVKFAKKRGNIIHFYNSKDKPENGYEYLHFHVAGKENMNRNKLEELRALVSRVLCVPLEFIVVTDIEATNSILITFMIPEGYSNIILELDHKDKEYLGSKGVDAVLCNGQTINCIALQTTGNQEETISKNEEVMMLLDQRSKADQELGSLQQLLLEKDRQIRNCQKTLQQMKQQVNWQMFDVASGLIQQYMEYKYTPKKCSLQDIALKNAYKYSRNVIGKAEKLGYDVDLIQCLIEANTIVVQFQSRSIHQWIETQQKQMILKLQQDVTALCYQRDKLAYFLKVGISNPVLSKNEEFFLKVLGMPLPLPTFKPNIKIQTEFGEIDLEFMKSIVVESLQMMDSSLSESDRLTLCRKFLPTSSDMKAFKESKMKLIEYLWFVTEVNTKGPDANFHEWMIIILTTIKKMNLLNVWITKSNEILQKFVSDLERRPAPQSQTQHQTAEHHLNRGGRSKPAQAHPADSKTENKAINERLIRLEEMMERNMKLTESIASGPIGQNPFRTPYPYGGTKLGSEAEYDWSKLSQSKFFTTK